MIRRWWWWCDDDNNGVARWKLGFRGDNLWQTGWETQTNRCWWKWSRAPMTVQMKIHEWRKKKIAKIHSSSSSSLKGNTVKFINTHIMSAQNERKNKCIDGICIVWQFHSKKKRLKEIHLTYAIKLMVWHQKKWNDFSNVISECVRPPHKMQVSRMQCDNRLHASRTTNGTLNPSAETTFLEPLWQDEHSTNRHTNEVNPFTMK